MSGGLQQLVTKGRAVGVGVVLTVSVLVSSVLSTLLGISLMSAFGIGIGDDPVVAFVASAVLAQTGILLVGYLYARWHGGLPVAFRAPRADRLQWAPVGEFAAVVAVAVSIAATDAANVLQSDTLEGFVLQGSAATVAAGVVMVFVAPPIEEYVFRGVIQQRLRSEFARTPAIVLATFLFTSLHIGDYGSASATGVGLAAIFLASLLYGLIYERTESLLVPILAHATYNAIVYVGFLTEIS